MATTRKTGITHSDIIDVKQAAQNSSRYLKGFYPTAEKILLEEVELSDDKKFWLITLSYESDDTGGGNNYQFLLSKAKRYKTFKIDAYTGDVLAMKIREVK
jgi:hypothetical protein